MYMINGRTQQVGRDDGRSLGFYGTGRLGMGNAPTLTPATITGPDGLPITINTSPANPTSSANDCTNGYDQYGVACQDFSSITSNPDTTAAAINLLYNSPSTLPIPASHPAATSSSFPSWLIYALAAVVVLVVTKR